MIWEGRKFWGKKNRVGANYAALRVNFSVGANCSALLLREYIKQHRRGLRPPPRTPLDPGPPARGTGRDGIRRVGPARPPGPISIIIIITITVIIISISLRAGL